MKEQALAAQMLADASEALRYYSETLEIRRDSLQPLLREGSGVSVPRVRLIYEGGELKPQDMNVLKNAVEATEDAVPGVEILLQ